MGTAADTVFLIAQSILDAVVGGYEEAGVPLPSRQVIADGHPIAHDCELVAVSLSRTYRGTASTVIAPTVPQRCFSLRTAEYHVWIVRCTSKPQENGEPPAAATITSFAQPILTDAWLLPYVLQTAALSDNLAAPCDDITVGQLTGLNPQGGFGGSDLIVEFQLGNV